MIHRNLLESLKEASGQYPVTTVTGPRQSGKTTLCRTTFPGTAYVTLEPHDTRDFATRDPRGFLARYREGAVLDEIQHAPALLSYLQGEVDERPEPGRFVLTGSQHFGLTQTVSQSLAGRTRVLTLLPPSLDELARFPAPPTELADTLVTGAFPRIHDRGIPATTWLADYVTTYLERDARQAGSIGDLQAFGGFLKLCAGRTAQVLNLSALGADAGVSHNTARAWLAVLEASYLVMRLPPWQRSVKKQVTKAPKLHFLDSGLACHLLGIHTRQQLESHPLRGPLFESWVVSEILKGQAHRGERPNVTYFRDRKGLEVDLVIDTASRVDLVEVKAGATVAQDFFRHLEHLVRLLDRAGETRPVQCWVVYGGDREQRRSHATVLPWSHVPTLGRL